jgi:hypothetical protein
LNPDTCLPSLPRSSGRWYWGEIFTPLNRSVFFVLLGHGSEGQCPFHRGPLITHDLYGFNEIVDDFFKKAPFILTD